MKPLTGIQRFPIFIVIVVLLSLSACAPNLGGGALPAPILRTAVPTSTLLPPSSTPLPTETPPPFSSPTITLTPIATLHPMMIEAMRLREYPGSEIVLEEQLENGANYSRYYAYYLSEGLKIYGLLTIPFGEKPSTGWPAIVFNHGYIPPDVYQTTERYIAYVDGLARSGYIVFRIDYRGHHNSEGDARGAYGDPGYAIDVLNAAASLRAHPDVDPQRIGMWGHSMGGYLTLRAMVIDPQIKVGVIWAGVVASYPDMLSRWRRSNNPVPTPSIPGFRGWRGSWVTAYGSPEDNPDFWAAVSSNSYLSEISGPLQLHHGTLDESVPLEFSELLSTEMQAAGKPVELYVYEGDNHNLSNYFTQAMLRTIAFYDEHLK